MNFDINDLTIGEVADIEEATGKSISTLFDGSGSQARTLQAVIWIVRRREDPTLTLEQAGNMTFTEMNSMLELSNDGGEVDPPEGAG